MFLLDTNIWLEELLEQERSKEVSDFLTRTPSSFLHITDFSYHSIGVIFSRLKMMDDFIVFTEDVLIKSNVTLIRLAPAEMIQIPMICKTYGLDFDDAYQYIAAKSHGLDIMSFDHDFDGTKLGRKEPKDV